MFSIINETQNKVVIEKSKFIAYIFNCSSMEEQSLLLKNLKRENLSATHICYASIFFKDNQILNYSSDDGEPSGTAGLQILQALKENNMINCLCAVVRYFGGIKLGVAGLGRAYKETALTVINENKKEVLLRTRCFVECDYNQYSNLKTWFDKNLLQVNDLQFDSNITFNTFLTLEEQELAQKLAQNVKSDKLEQKYC